MWPRNKHFTTSNFFQIVFIWIKYFKTRTYAVTKPFNELNLKIITNLSHDQSSVTSVWFTKLTNPDLD